MFLNRQLISYLKYVDVLNITGEYWVAMTKKKIQILSLYNKTRTKEKSLNNDDKRKYF